MGTTAQNNQPKYRSGPTPVTTRGVRHSARCECRRCLDRRRKIDREAKSVQERRRQRNEVGDSWRISPSRFAAWFKMVDDQREDTHVNSVTLKASWVRYLDAYTAKRVYGQMEYLYPHIYEAFLLAYPLDDDVDPLTQETIAAKLSMSQPTASRYLARGRFYFKALYEGLTAPGDVAARMERARPVDVSNTRIPIHFRA